MHETKVESGSPPRPSEQEYPEDVAGKVLIVDDEKTFRLVAQAALSAEGYEVLLASSGGQGVATARASRPDVVVLDRNLPDADGLSVLQALRAEGGADAPSVIMATAYGEVDNAVHALKAGAFDYLTKPLQLPDLVVTVRRAFETRRLEHRADSFSGVAQRRLSSRGFVGSSPGALRTVELAEKVATSPDTTVLITGESGTGKQVIAQLIHLRTPRRGTEPFVELNCAAVPEQLLESELFGHEPGAFTDAKRMRVGLLEQAENGTLFLDEIGDMPLATQAKLLKVLETQTFRRLGGSRDRTASVRFIAATHRDLQEAVKDGSFRLDLFHRLDVFRIDVPPLRQRREDILSLARAFLEEFASRTGKSIKALAPQLEQRLVQYAFPGNVRELRNLIERAVILESTPTLSAESVLLPEPRRAATGTPELLERDPPPTLEELERRYIERLLERADGNRSQVARWMGVSYPTVVKKIADYGIDLSRWKT
jgi:two-component system response regulator AtoC